MGVFSGLSTGGSSILNAARQIQVIGNNIANANTPGFKRSRATTSEAFYNTLSLSNGYSVDKSQVGNGASHVLIQRLITQGDTQITGVPLDTSIEGKGFFVLKDARDPAGQNLVYTRDGSFSLDNTRTLVHKGTNQAVQAFTLDANGAVTNILNNVVLPTGTSPGKITTKIEIQANLDSKSDILGTAGSFTSGIKKDEFNVITGTNDQVTFESGGSGLVTASLTTDGLLTSGTAVNGATVAQAIKTALEAKNGSGDTYTVTYDQSTDKFKIANDPSNLNTITFRHSNTIASTASSMLGFLAVDSEAIIQGANETSDLGVAFNVITGINDTLNVTIDGTALTVTVPAGNYTGSELARRIQQGITNSSAALQGTKVSYNTDGSLDRFALTSPKTGGAYIIHQPSNAATPNIAVASTVSTVAGGTLFTTTGFNTGTGKVGTGFFDVANPFATSTANVRMDVFDSLGGAHEVTIFVRKAGENLWEWHATLDASQLIDPTPGTERNEFIITAGTNDRLSFEVGGSGLLSADLIGGSGGSVISGAAVSGTKLATGIKNALEAADPSGDTYTVIYNPTLDKFTITNNAGNLNAITFRHSNPASTASSLLGFLAVDSAAIAAEGTEISDTGDAKFEEVASGLLRFDSEGKLDSETLRVGTGLFNFAPKIDPGPPIVATLPTPNQAIAFDFGSAISTDTTVTGTGDDGVSQFSAPNNDNAFSVNAIKVDGQRSGDFDALVIRQSGDILASFTNGEFQQLGRLGIALFAAEEDVSALGDNLFAETIESGAAQILSPNTDGAGKIIPGSIETSTTDLADEFVNLIVAQQIFQANARVITASDEILQSLTNI